jgi:uncharacterized membrane protein YdcZ (DUF606 family)
LKKQFFRIAAVSAGLILFLPLFFMGQVNRLEDYLLCAGLVSLGVGLLWLLVGLIFLISENSRKTGQAFLLTAAILFLASLTLCTTGAGSLDFK